MKKLKTTLIHFLGGMTVEEAKRTDRNSYDMGKHIAYRTLKILMDRNYGKPADEWCKTVYDFVTSRMEK